MLILKKGYRKYFSSLVHDKFDRTRQCTSVVSGTSAATGRKYNLRMRRKAMTIITMFVGDEIGAKFE